MNLNDIFLKEVEKAEAGLITGVDGRTVMAVCRANYDLWFDRLFPIWTSQGINCAEHVAQIFRGHGYDKVDGKLINDYLTRLHKERGLSKVEARRRNRAIASARSNGSVEAMNRGQTVQVSAVAVHEAVEPVKAVRPAVDGGAASTSMAAGPGRAAVCGVGSQEASELGDEPDWRAVCAQVGKSKPKEWSEELENIWHWLQRLGEERKFTEVQRTTVAGWRQLGSEFADLWVTLNLLRRKLGLSNK